MSKSWSGSRLLASAIFVWLVAVPALAQQMPDAQTIAGPPVGGRADRTSAERKLDTALMLAVRAFAPAATRGAIPLSLQPGVQSFIDENVAADQSIFVVIKADVSPDLSSVLRAAGAYDISEFPQYETITARVPITGLLDFASRTDVRSIGPQERYQLNRYFPTLDELATVFKDLPGFGTNAGSVNWQGVTAHQAGLAFNTGITGTGVKVCVLSDGVNTLAARQATGDLPAVTVLAGQAGSGDEGTAMLEIIHDMAPGAALGFATAIPSMAQFATNIQNLRTVAGCDIIVDDITYFAEGAFQDDIIAQAVNTVTTAGAMFFSSAANSGNVTHATSGTFEGDFIASAAAVPAAIVAAEGALPPGVTLVLHSFGANPYTTFTAASNNPVSLKWGAPNAGDTTDYDLFIMNSTGTTIIGGSSVDQTVGGAPFEIASCGSGCPSGARIYVVKFSGAARALRLDTNRGRIANGTTGSTFGHNAAASGFSVAAVNVGAGAVFAGGATNPVEVYSSDGPRRIFYTPAGAAITPGNILFATNGGTLLPKVDLTASDCGSTSTPLFTAFCGTSAAAPTAAAIAALIKSARPTATKAQITTALLNSALDIEAAGTDRDAGVGIVMAPAAVRGVLIALTIAKSFVPASIPSGTTSVLTIQVANPNTVALQGIAFTDTYPSPQVKNAAVPNAGVAPAGCGGAVAATGGGGTFAVTNATIPASTTCTFTVTVTSSTVGSYPDATGALTTPIALNTAAASATLVVTGGAGATPVLLSAVARKAHGVAGNFDLPLTLTTPPTVNHNPTTDSRAGPTHQLIFTYDKPLNAATIAVTEGTATVGGGSGVAGSTVVVNLTGVTNGQYVMVSLTGVGATDGGTGGVGTARVGFLEGDVNQSRVVTVSDVGLVNGVLAQSVTATNYLRDVNASGSLTVSDKGLTNARLTTALPAP